MSPPTTLANPTAVSRTDDVQAALNRMDEDGWELVSCFDHGNSGTMFIFRRMRTPETGIRAAGTIETGIIAAKSL